MHTHRPRIQTRFTCKVTAAEREEEQEQEQEQVGNKGMSLALLPAILIPVGANFNTGVTIFCV